MRHLLIAGLMLLSSLSWAQKEYYINVSGNDNREGSISAPWKTVAAANSFDFEPGDKLFFAGGQTFGKLELGKKDNGLTITSYNGVATLSGLFAWNVGGITIEDIGFKGPGATGNDLSGISFYMDSLSFGDLDNVTINNTTVTNFGAFGIAIGAGYTANGYNNIRISNSSVNNNGKGGFLSYGNKDLYNHTNLTLYKVKAFQNYGRTDILSTNTGSGITVSGIDGALVEYCEAYENGKYNRSSTGGRRASGVTMQKIQSFNIA